MLGRTLGGVVATLVCLLSVPASAELRVERPAGLAVGTDAERDTRLIDAIVARAGALGIDRALASGLDLRVSELPVLGGTGLAMLEVAGRFGNVPLSRPIARALIDASGHVRLLTRMGSVGPLVSRQAHLDAPAALGRLEASGLPGSLGATSAELVVAVGADASNLVWRIDPPFDARSSSNPVFFVDARTGQVRIAHDQVDFAQVRAWETDPVVTPQAANYDLIEIDEPAATLVGPTFTAYNCLATGEPNCTLTQTAMADQNGDFIYPEPDIDVVAEAEDPDDEFAEVSAYYHADKFHDHLTNTLGFPGLPCTLQGQQNVLISNYHLFNNAGDPFKYGNAGHTGDCSRLFLFGQADGADYAYEGDIVYHEVFHSVTKGQMGPERELREVRMLPEAVVLDARNINEGLSDLFSCTFSDDPSYSQYMAQYYWAYVPRNLDNTYSCPNSLTGSRHQDSEFFSGALWDAHETLGDPLLVAVIDSIAMFAEDISYDEASKVIETMVEAQIGADAATTVREALSARGIYDPCQRVVPHDSLERQKMFVYELESDSFTWNPMRPPPYQIAFQLPDDADTVDFTFMLDDLWGDGFDLNMLVKEDAPIEFSYQVAGALVTVEGESGTVLPGLNVGSGRFSATPGATAYGAFYNLGNNRVAVLDVQVQFSCENPDGCSPPGDTGDTSAGTTEDGGGTTADESTGDGGQDADGGGGSGCGCRTERRAALLPWLGIFVLGRRRQSNT